MTMMFFALSTAINCVVLDKSLESPVDQVRTHALPSHTVRASRWRNILIATATKFELNAA